MASVDGISAAAAESQRLRQACHEYYLSQQALQTAEEDRGNLENVMNNLTQQLEQKRRALEQVRQVKEKVQFQADAVKHLPAGVPSSQAQDYIELEKKLHTTLALADGAFQETTEKTTTEKLEINKLGSTVTILEESLAAQVKFNKILLASRRDVVKRAEHEQERHNALAARKVTLQKELVTEQKKNKKLASMVETRNTMKSRALSDLRERDFDTLRMRKDAAFAKRVYLSEVEHAREQELQLEALLAENKKLKTLLANSRKQLPTTLPSSGGAEATSTTAAAGAATVTRRDGTAVPVAIESNRTAWVSTANRGDFEDDGESREKMLVRKFQEYNMALMQQMVNSMHMLVQEAEAPITKH